MVEMSGSDSPTRGGFPLGENAGDHRTIQPAGLCTEGPGVLRIADRRLAVDGTKRACVGLEINATPPFGELGVCLGNDPPR